MIMINEKIEKIGYCLSYTLIYNVMFASAFALRGYEDKVARIMLAIFLICIVIGIAATIGIVSVDDLEKNEATAGKYIGIVASENITRKKYVINFMLMMLSGIIISFNMDWRFLTLFWAVELLYSIPCANSEAIDNNPVLLILGYNVLKCTGKNVFTDEVGIYRIITKKSHVKNGAIIKFKNVSNHTLKLNKDIAYVQVQD